MKRLFICVSLASVFAHSAFAVPLYERERNSMQRRLDVVKEEIKVQGDALGTYQAGWGAITSSLRRLQKIYAEQKPLGPPTSMPKEPLLQEAARLGGVRGRLEGLLQEARTAKMEINAQFELIEIALNGARIGVGHPLWTEFLSRRDPVLAILDQCEKEITLKLNQALDASTRLQKAIQEGQSARERQNDLAVANFNKTWDQTVLLRTWTERIAVRFLVLAHQKDWEHARQWRDGLRWLQSETPEFFKPLSVGTVPKTLVTDAFNFVQKTLDMMDRTFREAGVPSDSDSHASLGRRIGRQILFSFSQLLPGEAAFASKDGDGAFDGYDGYDGYDGTADACEVEGNENSRTNHGFSEHAYSERLPSGKMYSESFNDHVISGNTWELHGTHGRVTDRVPLENVPASRDAISSGFSKAVEFSSLFIRSDWSVKERAAKAAIDPFTRNVDETLRIVDRARESTDEIENRLELDQISRALNELARLTRAQASYLDDVTDRALLAASATLPLAESAVKDLLAFLQAVEADLMPTASDVIKTTADIGAGMVMGLTYDLGNFASALAFDRTLLGDDASSVREKSFLGAMVILDVVPVTNLAGRIAKKASEKSPRVAAVVTKAIIARQVMGRLTNVAFKKTLGELAKKSDHVLGYVQRALDSNRYTEEALERLVERYAEIREKAAVLQGEAVLEKETRSMPRSWIDEEGRTIEATEALAFSPNEYNRAGNHRYTAPGHQGVYVSTGENAVETAIAESGRGPGKYVIFTREKKYDKLLDLTDPQVLEHLGIKESEITVRSNLPDAYEISQMIGEIATELGFDGIKFPSTVSVGGTNIVQIGGLK